MAIIGWRLKVEIGRDIHWWPLTTSKLGSNLTKSMSGLEGREDGNNCSLHICLLSPNSNHDDVNDERLFVLTKSSFNQRLKERITASKSISAANLETTVYTVWKFWAFLKHSLTWNAKVHKTQIQSLYMWKNGRFGTSKTLKIDFTLNQW